MRETRSPENDFSRAVAQPYAANQLMHNLECTVRSTWRLQLNRLLSKHYGHWFGGMQIVGIRHELDWQNNHFGVEHGVRSAVLEQCRRVLLLGRCRAWKRHQWLDKRSVWKKTHFNGICYRSGRNRWAKFTLKLISVFNYRDFAITRTAWEFIRFQNINSVKTS